MIGNSQLHGGSNSRCFVDPTEIVVRGVQGDCTDLLFKKLFDLSDTVEFMFGVGPQWAHILAQGKSGDTVAGEVVLDFTFWPWAGRKIGFYLESGYDYSFAAGHEQSMAITGGLLIPIQLVCLARMISKKKARWAWPDRARFRVEFRSDSSAENKMAGAGFALGSGVSRT
jgi:hypothetical protein